VRPLFAVTLFVSAFLLFLIQPMIARMLLPLLGGSPAVWSTCMVFFQALLLAGYAYAHFVPPRLGIRRHAIVHVGVMLLPLLVLPIRVRGWTPPAIENPTPWLLTALLAVAGLPFFALSTGAPLLQRWFAGTRDPAARDPYFLYGASNLGSMVALLGYPTLIEPNLRLASQTLWWAIGYGVLVALTAACAVVAWRAAGAGAAGEATTPVSDAGRAASEQVPRAAGGTGAIGRARRVRWVGLALVPSSLMLGVTTYVTTDVTAIPLLWVIPLAIYLLTFIVVFSRPPAAIHRVMVALMPAAIVALVVVRMLQASLGIGTLLAAHLIAFFVAAMACHGELAADRPPPRFLTEFYMWMSVGGVLGGAFNALVAPRLFDRVVEYPLMMAAACLLFAWRLAPPPAPAASRGRGGQAAHKAPTPRRGFRLSPGWIALALLGGAAFFIQSYDGDPRYFLLVQRNFFGVLRVVVNPVEHLIGLRHGTTVHGVQSLEPSRRREPLSYYSRTGPFGDVFASLTERGAVRRVGVVGLGIGTLASYAEAGQEWTFYEIDPAVERVARDSTRFSYLADASARGARWKVVLGDARLSLARADDRFDLLVLDAFTSDAIPVHLLTREALRVYLARLAPHGVLALHISGKYVRLENVMADLARDAGLACDLRTDRPDAVAMERGVSPSTWVVMARSAEDLGALGRRPGWERRTGRAEARVWSDDYSNVFGVIRWARPGGPAALPAEALPR
jgi:spermidine synthase